MLWYTLHRMWNGFHAITTTLPTFPLSFMSYTLVTTHYPPLKTLIETPLPPPPLSSDASYQMGKMGVAVFFPPSLRTSTLKRAFRFSGMNPTSRHLSHSQGLSGTATWRCRCPHARHAGESSSPCAATSLSSSPAQPQLPSSPTPRSGSGTHACTWTHSTPSRNRCARS